MEAVPVVSKTGAINYQKLAAFAQIPADVLEQVAEQFGKGELKYPRTDGVPNFLLGMDWDNLVNSAERHLNAFKRGEDIDVDMDEYLHTNHCPRCKENPTFTSVCDYFPETYHLAAAIWNLVVLFHYQLNNKGTDYRGKWDV